jgi:phage gpG-like protein
LKINGAIKVFHDKQKLKQYMTTKSPLQKILQGILHTENESKQNLDRTGRPNYRRKDKELESNIDAAAHNQTLKQQKQLNDRNHHIPININTEC